jgi:hypothetical protein
MEKKNNKLNGKWKIRNNNLRNKINKIKIIK